VILVTRVERFELRQDLGSGKIGCKRLHAIKVAKPQRKSQTILQDFDLGFLLQHHYPMGHKHSD
jgi:hypothetical protein